MRKAIQLIALTALVWGVQSSQALAALIVINDNNSGSSTERGVAFDLTNTSTSDTIQLTGIFNLPVTTTGTEAFDLWIRTGTVVGNVGAAATNWTSYGTASATGLGYASPGFNLTSYDFTSAAGFTLAPGQTIGIWIKDSNQSASFRYINGGSSTVTATDGFTNGGLRYDGYVGLGSTGNAPNVANSTFGPTRNFIGEIGYTVIPEPSTYALLLGGLGALVWLRRRAARS